MFRRVRLGRLVEASARSLGFASALLPLSWLASFYAYVVSIRLDAGVWPRRDPTGLARWSPIGTGWEAAIDACDRLEPLISLGAGSVIQIVVVSFLIAATSGDLETRRWRVALLHPLPWIFLSWSGTIAIRFLDPGGLLVLLRYD